MIKNKVWGVVVVVGGLKIKLCPVFYPTLRQLNKTEISPELLALGVESDRNAQSLVPGRNVNPLHKPSALHFSKASESDLNAFGWNVLELMISPDRDVSLSSHVSLTIV
jgi:hypothetical protein